MSDLENNKRIVVDYYQTAFDGNGTQRKPSPGTSEIAMCNTSLMQPMARRRS
jgi:hypothetical protein